MFLCCSTQNQRLSSKKLPSASKIGMPRERSDFTATRWLASSFCLNQRGLHELMKSKAVFVFSARAGQPAAGQTLTSCVPDPCHAASPSVTLSANRVFQMPNSGSHCKAPVLQRGWTCFEWASWSSTVTGLSIPPQFCTQKKLSDCVTDSRNPHLSSWRRTTAT